MKTALIIVNLLLPLCIVATFLIHDDPPPSRAFQFHSQPNGTVVTTVPPAIATYNARCDAYRSLAVEDLLLEVWHKRLKLRLSASLYFEKDLRSRLVVKSAVGKEGDMGSNDKTYWLWCKRVGNGLLYAEHTDKVKLNPEYRPSELWGSFGLIRLPMDRVKVVDKGERFEVIETCPTYAKVYYINKQTARLDAYLICDLQGNTLLTSEVMSYNGDCPSQILYQWPREDASVLMNLKDPKLNATLSIGLWEMPNITPQVNLATSD